MLSSADCKIVESTAIDCVFWLKIGVSRTTKPKKSPVVLASVARAGVARFMYSEKCVYRFKANSSQELGHTAIPILPVADKAQNASFGPPERTLRQSNS